MKICDNCGKETEYGVKECSCGNTLFQIDENEDLKIMLHNSYIQGKEDVINDFEKSFSRDSRQGAWKLAYFKLGLLKRKHLPHKYD